MEVRLEDFWRPSDQQQFGTAFQRIQESLTGSNADEDHVTIKLAAGGVYHFTSTLDVIRRTSIVGEGYNGFQPVLGDPTVSNMPTMHWTENVCGMITHYPSDSNGACTFGDGTRTDVDGPLSLFNVALRGNGTTSGLHCHGINAHRSVHLFNASISYFGGCGLKANSSHGSVENRGNCNFTNWTNGNVRENGGIGVLIQGGDSNGCYFLNIATNDNAGQWVPGLSGVNVSQIANTSLLPNTFIQCATGEQINGGVPFYDHSSAGSVWITPYVEGGSVLTADIATPTMIIGGTITAPSSGAIIDAGVDATIRVTPALRVSNVNASGSVVSWVGDPVFANVVQSYYDSATDGGGRLRLHHNQVSTGNEDHWEWVDTGSSTLRWQMNTGIANRRDGRARIAFPSGFRYFNRNTGADAYVFTDTQGGIPLDLKGVGTRALISSASFTAGQNVVITTSAAHNFFNGQRVFINTIGVTSGALPITNGTYYNVINQSSTTFALANTNGLNAALYSGSSGIAVGMRAEGWAATLPTTGNFAPGDRLWRSQPSASGSPGWICINTGSTGGTWQSMPNLM